MARLEDITVGASIVGLAGNASVSVVAIKWHGTNAITVTLNNNAGNVAEQIEPLPHQISAVYKEMLPRLPLRYILADDPGAGKTIMTGLFLKELLIRGDLKRCMIVSSGNLAEQWQDELLRATG